MTDLVIGRGQVFFNRFPPGTLEGPGELYLGNTPEFATSRQLEVARKLNSWGGRKVDVEGVITREIIKGQFTTDHISVDNVALWFGSEVETATEAASSDVTEFVTVAPGHHYSLGQSVDDPAGRPGAVINRLRVGGITKSIVANLDLDPVRGRFAVKPFPVDITGPMTIEIRYDVPEQTRSRVVSEPAAQHGSLRFVSTNPVGPKTDIFLPYVRLSSTGQFDGKSTTWQQLAFDFEAKRLSRSHEYAYIESTNQ